MDRRYIKASDIEKSVKLLNAEEGKVDPHKCCSPLRKKQDERCINCIILLIKGMSSRVKNNG